MPENPIQHDLLGLFEQTREVTQTFVASRGATERAAVGGEEEWSAKDLLANVACWMDYMVQRMAYFTRGETPPRDVDFDAVSRQAFLAYQHAPWDAAVAYAERSLDTLITTVQGRTDEQLTANNTYGDDAGGPLWGEIRANAFTYSLQEFEKFYRRTGDTARAAEVHARLVAVIGEAQPIECNLIAAPALAAQRAGAATPLVVDVRGPNEYAAGHVLGAINIPLAELEQRLAQIPVGEPVVTYCNMHNKGASRGERAAAFLAGQGYDTAALDGGFPGWQSAGLPTEVS